VIARNSSFVYKGRSPDIRQVRRELGVRYVLEGSVRKAASKVRITGQLIDSENGAHIWADRLDGALKNIFELQDQVTTKVVGAIAPKLNLGRYAEASNWAMKALARQPDFAPAMRVGTAAHALAGNMPEARRILGQLGRLDPTLTQSSYRSKTFFRRTVDIERFVEGFRLAGMPE